MIWKTIRTTMIVMAAAGGTLLAAEKNWKPLFNGENLGGWVKRGGEAPFTVEDGTIVGTAVTGTPNTFLCPDHDYADFVLEYEFKVDPRLNSGVQIRSQQFDEPTVVIWDSKIIRVPAGRVHGYQIEIDPEPDRDRWWTAGVFDEACRGWLYPGSHGGDGDAFTNQGRDVFKNQDWNHVRVEAIGHRVKTWLNGELRADLHDSRVPSGFIGLQVHSIGKADREGAQVRWRNLRIQDLGGLPNTLSDEEKSAGWRLLWDGKTTAGWRSISSEDFPTHGWEIKNDMLIINNFSNAGDIITEETFSDFELQLDFKLTLGGNSGIRMFIGPETEGGPISPMGIEYQIADDFRNSDAERGPNNTTGSLYQLLPAPQDKTLMPVGGWNRAHILSRGNKVTFRLNGEMTVEFERGSEEFRNWVANSRFKGIAGFGQRKDGHILLEDRLDMVFYQNIKIRTEFE